jgi:hypothetical protein
MSDPRPSENQDAYPKFPTLVAQFGQTFEPPATNPIDHKAEAEQEIPFAEQAGSPTAAISAAAHAVLYLAEQQRIANLIAFEQISGEKNRAEIRKGLGL